jgi:hypothetical protein
MKIVLNHTSRDAIMKAWLANNEDRWQIFIISSHKQTKRSRSIKFSTILSTSFCTRSLVLNSRVTRTRLRCHCSFVLGAFRTFSFLLSSVRLKLWCGLFQDKVKVFSIFRGCGLINEALYKPRFTVLLFLNKLQTNPFNQKSGEQVIVKLTSKHQTFPSNRIKIGI